jgi:hypothetical protein
MYCMSADCLTTHLFFFDFLLCLGGGLWLIVRDLLRLRCLSEAWLLRLQQRTEHMGVFSSPLQPDSHSIQSHPNEGNALPDKASSPTRRSTVMMFVLARAGWRTMTRPRMRWGGAIAASARRVIARQRPDASHSTGRGSSGLHTGLLITVPQFLHTPFQFLCVRLQNQ